MADTPSKEDLIKLLEGSDKLEKEALASQLEKSDFVERRAKSGYEGIPDEDLSLLQKADRFVSKPGMEFLSPKNAEAKLTAAKTAAVVTPIVATGMAAAPYAVAGGAAVANNPLVRRLGSLAAKAIPGYGAYKAADSIFRKK